MCMSAIEWGGFGRVIYGTSIRFIMAQGQKQINLRATDVARRSGAGFNGSLTVIGGVLESETNRLYRGQAATVRHHRHDKHSGMWSDAVPGWVRRLM